MNERASTIKLSVGAFIVSAIIAVLLLAMPARADAYGTSYGASLNIPCGGTYSTVYEAFNELWVGTAYCPEAYSTIRTWYGVGPAGDIGVQAALMNASNNSCYGYTAWIYNKGYTIPQGSYFRAEYDGGQKGKSYYSWGNPSVWRSAQGKYEVYKTGKTATDTWN
jgi:hypothetical protein